MQVHRGLRTQPHGRAVLLPAADAQPYPPPGGRIQARPSRPAQRGPSGEAVDAEQRYDEGKLREAPPRHAQEEIQHDEGAERVRADDPARSCCDLDVFFFNRAIPLIDVRAWRVPIACLLHDPSQVLF